MAHKRVTISIDENVNKLWNKVSRKHRITKSGMVEIYLKKILHELDHTNISDAKNYDELLCIKELQKNLFDSDHDQSVEDYKEMKRKFK